MRKLILSIFLLLSFLSFNSCESVAQAVVDTVLGREKCGSPGCNRDASSGSYYCMMHSQPGGYEVPQDLGKKTNESINKQLKEFRESEKKLNQTQASTSN